MKLDMEELKEELTRAPCDRKEVWPYQLSERGTLYSVPVSNPVVNQHKSMNGVDVTAKWVALTINDAHIPETTNNAKLWPCTKCYVPTNPKYGFTEEFKQVPIQGATSNVTYTLKPTSNGKQRNEGSILPKRATYLPQQIHCHPMKEFNMNQMLHNLKKASYGLDECLPFQGQILRATRTLSLLSQIGPSTQT